MRVAVIGGGAAGLSAAWMLSRRYQTVLFESAARLGGHANTIDVALGGWRFPVDTGFIVYNELNYPNLTHLFRAVDVATDASNMSFSVSIDGGRIEYAGDPAGVFAQRSNLWRADHWRMLRDIGRFNTAARNLLRTPAGDTVTVGRLLAEGGYSKAFAEHHILPMAAAIWSSTFDEIRGFPARSFAQFFANHGLLGLRGRPQWRTVAGGSRNYVERIVATGSFEVRDRSEIHHVARMTSHGRQKVIVHPIGAPDEVFDRVVFATPANSTLGILGTGAMDHERAVLGAFRYRPNRAVVHCDPSLLPRRRRVWASWNYLTHGRDTSHRAGNDTVSVSYWMNRLQRLPVTEPVVVSLNPLTAPAPDRVFAEFSYQHPQFDQAAIDAQARLPDLQGNGGAWYCGSYCGYGFHEDAVASAFAVTAALGAPAPWAHTITPRTPAGNVVQPRPDARPQPVSETAA